MYFHQPAFLWLLMLVPIWLFWYRFWYRPRRLVLQMSKVPSSARERKAGLTLLSWLPRGLLLLAVTLLVLALARPRTAESYSQQVVEGVNVVVAIDISKSMETEDVTPNRLGRAKQIAQDFLRALKGDRTGLVVFSEGALAYAPLTLDYNYLRSQIAQLETNLLPKEGTVLGDAVGAALNRLHDEATQRGGAVLLLSDGAVNQGRFPPITAAQLARERGTQVFTIGIGRPDSSGAARRGTVAEANFQPLRQLADSTGGRFYAYTNPDAPGAVADAIHQMNQQVVGKRLQRNVQEYYPLMLGLALGCFLAAMVLIALGFYNAMEGI